MTALLDIALAIHQALERANVPHAFGGALALAYHVEEPRATRDIDINVFLPSTDARATLSILPKQVGWSQRDVAEIERDGQIRLFWDGTPIDLFFMTHEFHRNASLHTREVPLGGEWVPILAADDLAVFKAFFNRTKDWADIEAMVDVEAVDLHSVIGWLVDLLGADDERVDRTRALLSRIPTENDPRFGS